MPIDEYRRFRELLERLLTDLGIAALQPLLHFVAKRRRVELTPFVHGGVFNGER